MILQMVAFQTPWCLGGPVACSGPWCLGGARCLLTGGLGLLESDHTMMMDSHAMDLLLRPS